MAKTPVQNGTTVIDPMFAIPEGAVGLEYAPAHGSAGANDTSEDTTGVELEGGEEGYEGVVYDDVPGHLETPQILSVVSQTLRRGPGGANVVDVVLEVEDIDGAETYDFRVAKA